MSKYAMLWPEILNGDRQTKNRLESTIRVMYSMVEYILMGDVTK